MSQVPYPITEEQRSRVLSLLHERYQITGLDLELLLGLSSFSFEGTHLLKKLESEGLVCRASEQPKGNETSPSKVVYKLKV